MPISVFHTDRDNIILHSKDSSRITHTHSLAMDGTMIQACAIDIALSLDPADDLEKNRSKFITELEKVIGLSNINYVERFKVMKKLLCGQPDPDEIIVELGNSTVSINSIPTAIFCFLFHMESFRNALEYAVSLGGDTDTIGSMTGAIAGAYYGYSGIPIDWVDKLENGRKGRDYIIRLAKQLFKLHFLEIKTRA